jgi:hypothetical protein
MACCGQKRQQISRANPIQPANSPAPKISTPGQQQFQPQGIAFQYTGKSALTAIGPVSGRQYRFGHPGAIVSVDSRDALSLGTVPNLRRV